MGFSRKLPKTYLNILYVSNVFVMYILEVVPFSGVRFESDKYHQVFRCCRRRTLSVTGCLRYTTRISVLQPIVVVIACCCYRRSPVPRGSSRVAAVAAIRAIGRRSIDTGTCTRTPCTRRSHGNKDQFCSDFMRAPPRFIRYNNISRAVRCHRSVAAGAVSVCFRECWATRLYCGVV